MSKENGILWPVSLQCFNLSPQEAFENERQSLLVGSWWKILQKSTECARGVLGPRRPCSGSLQCKFSPVCVLARIRNETCLHFNQDHKYLVIHTSQEISWDPRPRRLLEENSCNNNANSRKGSHRLPKRMLFYTLCKRPLTPPPPLGFTQSCCGFFDMTVKKCVNVCRDKIPHNSAKICEENVKFTLKLRQFYPSKFFFLSNLCWQMASRVIQICNIIFYTWLRAPLPPLNNV